MKIHNGFFGFTAMQSFSSYLCHSSAYSKKKIMWARKGLPISLMTIILHRTKAVISSITPLYIVKREIKYKKKPSSTSDDLSETIDSELFINKSHVILHALQKLQYIYKFQWDFPLSLLLSLSTILIIIHYSLKHWCNAMGKQGPKSWLLDKNISNKGLGSGLTDNDNKDDSCRSQGDHALDRVSQEF